MIRVGKAVKIRQFFKEDQKIEWQRLDYLLPVITIATIIAKFKMVEGEEHYLSHRLTNEHLNRWVFI